MNHPDNGNMPAREQARLLDVDSASNYLATSVSTIRRLATSGQLASVRVRRRLLFDRNDLDAFIDRSRQAADAS